MKNFDIWKKPNGEKMNKEEVKKEKHALVSRKVRPKDSEDFSKIPDRIPPKDGFADAILSKVSRRIETTEIINKIDKENPLFGKIKKLRDELDELESDSSIRPIVKRHSIEVKQEELNDLLEKAEKIVESN